MSHIYQNLRISNQAKVQLGNEYLTYNLTIPQQHSREQDAITLAVAISGLKGLTTRLYEQLDDCIKGLGDPPQAAVDMHNEIGTYKATLLDMESHLSRITAGDERFSLIPASQVFISFTSAVLLLDKVNSTLSPLVNVEAQAAVGDIHAARSRWVRRESSLKPLTSRLQWQNMIFTMQLKVLQCKTPTETQDATSAVDEKLTIRLSQDLELNRRIASLETDIQDTLSQRHRGSMSLASESVLDSDSIRTITRQNAAETIDSDAEQRQFEFDEALKSTRVYRQNQIWMENLSIAASSARRSIASTLSELSLADVSVISVIALPVTSAELVHGQWYQTPFSDEDKPSGDTAEAVGGPTQGVAGDSQIEVVAQPEEPELPPPLPQRVDANQLRRWREALAQHDMKRSESIWAANKGLYCSFNSKEEAEYANLFVSQQRKEAESAFANEISNIVVRDLWLKHKLPRDVLEVIWNLVDHRSVGRLNKREFVMGMVLLDQCLKGREMPTRVPDVVWNLVEAGKSEASLPHSDEWIEVARVDGRP